MNPRKFAIVARIAIAVLIAMLLFVPEATPTSFAVGPMKAAEVMQNLVLQEGL